MKKYILNPKVVRGGKAIPLGNNFYYMRGRKHEQGGIDLGADDKNGLEVEGGEVVHTSKNSIKVFSAVPMLNGKSPAEKIINGENANKVFKEQEEFKDRNNLMMMEVKSIKMEVKEDISEVVLMKQDKNILIQIKNLQIV